MSANPTPDALERAREVLAAEYERRGFAEPANKLRQSRPSGWTTVDIALHAIASALTPASVDGPFCVYSEPDVGLPPSLFEGHPGETGFAPVNLDDSRMLHRIANALNATLPRSTDVPGREKVDPDARTGCGDDRKFANVSPAALREAAKEIIHNSILEEAKQLQQLGGYEAVIGKSPTPSASDQGLRETVVEEAARYIEQYPSPRENWPLTFALRELAKGVRSLSSTGKD